MLATASGLLLGLSLPARAEQFSDMPDDWSRPALESAVENGLLLGAGGRIMPGESLTRAQLAAIISRSFGAETPAPLDAYSDIAADAWYYRDMAIAVGMGVFQGEGGRLYPDRPVTREEAFTVLARAFRLGTADFSPLDGFRDGGDFGGWARSAAAALADAGYIHGSGGALHPKNSISRAEFFQLVHNMAQGYLSAPGAYTQLPGGNIVINTPGVTLRDVVVRGDLILGEGVGSDIVLENVRVEGRVLLRGSGLQIGGRSAVGALIVCSTDGPATVTASAGADVGRVVVDEGSADVTLRGSYGSLTLLARGSTVTAENARIGSADLRGENSTLVIGKGSDVGEIKKDAPGAAVTDQRPPSSSGDTTPTAPQVPAFLSAVCEQDGSTYIYAAFSRAMDESSLQASDFTVTAVEPDSPSAVSVTAAALKPGDPEVVILTLDRTPRPEDTILLSYTAGGTKAQNGGILPGFTGAAVSNRIIGALTLSLSEDLMDVPLGSVKLSVYKNTAELVGYALQYAVRASVPAAPVPGAVMSDIASTNDLGFDEAGQLAGVQAGDWIAVYGYEPGGIIKYFGSVQAEEKHLPSHTAAMPLSLTAPSPGPGNSLDASGDAAPTVTVGAVNGTLSVTLSGVKKAAQTVVIGGTDAAFVSAGGSATAPSFTVDTAALAALGGSRRFTLTVKETNKLDRVYTLTVTVKGPGEAVTGVGTADTVLQLGETISRTAETAQSGVKTWSSSAPAVAGIDAASGIVTAKSAGTAVLSYITDEGEGSAVSVTVYAAAAAANPAIAPVEVGAADVTPTGFTAPAGGESIAWVSSDTTKATVDSSSGLIHAVAAGETTISYRVTEISTGRTQAKGSRTITVLGEIAPPLTALTLAPGDGGGTTKVTAAPYAGASWLVFKLEAAAYTGTLRVGDSAPVNFDALTLNADILAASGQHLIVVALDGLGRVLAVSDHTLLTAQINGYALYISDYIGNAIVSWQSDGSALSTPVSDADPTNGDCGPMAVTAAGETLYWAQQDGKYIYRSNLDGADQAPVVDTGSSNVSGLAVDPAGGRIYWADYTANAIKSARLSDGTDIQTVVTNADNSAGSYKGPLALTLSGGRLYWAGDVSGKIESCALDGTDRKDVVSTGAGPQSVNSFAVYGGKIYWNDYAANRIRRASLTGGGVETVVSTADNTAAAVKGVTAIAVKSGMLYWSCASDGSVRRIDADGMGSTETVCAPTSPKRAINGLYCA